MRNLYFKSIILSVFMGLLCVNSWAQTKSTAEDAVQIIYVSSTGTGDGSSWENASSLNDAVTLANTVGSHQMWLKTGTYVFAASVNFDNLYIYGGFAGTEENLSERNWNANPVIFDGNNSVSPLRNRATVTGPAIECILDGVIVQNSLNPSAENAGAILANDGTIIRNCIFRQNQTQNSKNGAAVHCQIGTIKIENCLFINNSSSANGGALQVGGNATCIIVNCTFANNKAVGLGGAIGVGANNSNCTFINTIAYNNQASSGSSYESYAQNGGINAGGVIISNHSAIESTSTKFLEANDVNHISLSRAGTPGFVSVSEYIGKLTNPAEIAAANSASYALAEGSVCINVGKSDEATGISFDLAHNARIQETGIDIGAYEFQPTPTSIFNPTQSALNIIPVVAENELHILGAEKGQQLYLFDIRGALIYSQKVISEDEYIIIPLNQRGIYVVKTGENVVKVKY